MKDNPSTDKFKIEREALRNTYGEMLDDYATGDLIWRGSVAAAILRQTFKQIHALCLSRTDAEARLRLIDEMCAFAESEALPIIEECKPDVSVKQKLHELDIEMQDIGDAMTSELTRRCKWSAEGAKSFTEIHIAGLDQLEPHFKDAVIRKHNNGQTVAEAKRSVYHKLMKHCLGKGTKYPAAVKEIAGVTRESEKTVRRHTAELK